MTATPDPSKPHKRQYATGDTLVGCRYCLHVWVLTNAEVVADPMAFVHCPRCGRLKVNDPVADEPAYVGVKEEE